jgi:hypothetical protein
MQNSVRIGRRCHESRESRLMARLLWFQGLPGPASWRMLIRQEAGA